MQICKYEGIAYLSISYIFCVIEFKDTIEYILIMASLFIAFLSTHESDFVTLMAIQKAPTSARRILVWLTMSE